MAPKIAKRRLPRPEIDWSAMLPLAGGTLLLLLSLLLSLLLLLLITGLAGLVSHGRVHGLIELIQRLCEKGALELLERIRSHCGWCVVGGAFSCFGRLLGSGSRCLR